MTFGPSWNNLLENIEELPTDATLVTPLSRKAFGVEDVSRTYSETPTTYGKIFGVSYSTGFTTTSR